LGRARKIEKRRGGEQSDRRGIWEIFEIEKGDR
jgi:hypothetical protein